MKRLLGALVALCILPTTACVPAAIAVGSGISHTADAVTLSGVTALTVAADAYTGVATLTEAAVRHGAFNSTQLQMINTLNDKAIGLINGANSGLSVAERAASLSLIVTQLHSILGK